MKQRLILGSLIFGLAVGIGLLASQAGAETERKITSINPTSGRVGTQVTITGRGFEPDCGGGHWCVMSVAFGEGGAQWDGIVEWSDTTIIAIVPQNATTGEIRVTYYYDENGIDEGGVVASYTLTGPKFAVIPSNTNSVNSNPVPTYNTECKKVTPDADRRIDDVQPRQGMPGDKVTITGLGFETDCGGGHSCTFGMNFDDGTGVGNIVSENLIGWSNTRIVIRVPMGAKTGVTKVGMYCDSNGIDPGGNLIQYSLEGPVFTVLQPVTTAYGCSYSTTTSDASHVKVRRMFASGSESDVYLKSVSNAYNSSWKRAPRCDELQFHLDHNTPLARLQAWLAETPSTSEADQPAAPAVVSADAPSAAKTAVASGGTLVFEQSEPITLAGTTVPNAVVTLEFSSEPFTAATTADAQGEWTYTLTKDLGVGEHTVQAVARDPSGNESPKSVPLAFQIVAKAASAKTTTATPAAETTDWTWAYVLVGAAVVLLIVAFAVRSKQAPKA